MTEAEKWTKEMKEKITKEANQPFDQVIFDSANYRLTFYKENRKLKEFTLRPNIDFQNGKIISYDTAVSTFYSTDKKFELIRELCPVSNRIFEGIHQKSSGHIGLYELRFCNGAIMKRGYRYQNKDIGIWTTFDSTGKVVTEKDYGNIELLKKLPSVE